MNVGILFEIIQWFTVKGDDTGLALSANQSPTLRNVSPLLLSLRQCNLSLWHSYSASLDFPMSSSNLHSYSPYKALVFIN